MTGRRARAYELANQIAALRKQLASLEDEFARLIPDEPEAESRAAIPRPEKQKVGRPGKLKTQLLEVLRKHPEQKFLPEALRELIGRSTADSIRGTLRRMTKEGLARRLETGEYQTADESKN